MRGSKEERDTSKRPVAVDKSIPPAFVAKRGARRLSPRWWSGLTPAGRWAVAVLGIAVVAVVAGLVLSLAGSKTTGSDAKPPPMVKPKPPDEKSAKKVVPFSFSKSRAALDIAVLASGLHIVLDSISETSQDLLEELGSATDTQGGVTSGLTASLDVLADGPEEPVPSPPSTDLGKRYVNRYREYLALVTDIRKAAEAAPMTEASAQDRRALVKACDEISRDTSIIIAGLEKLGTDPEEDAVIAEGIASAQARIDETSKRLDNLIESLRDASR